MVGGEGATVNLVTRYGLGVTCESEINSLKRLLLGLVEGAIQVPCASKVDIEQFGYRSLTGQLATVLDEAVEVFQQRQV